MVPPEVSTCQAGKMAAGPADENVDQIEWIFEMLFFWIRCHRLVIDVLFRLEPFLRPSLTTGTNWLPDE